MRKKLVELYPISLISIDEILDRENMWRDGHPTQDDWDKAYSEAFKNLRVTLQEGKDDIFDEPNESENPLIYDWTVPMDEWINQHIQLPS